MRSLALLSFALVVLISSSVAFAETVLNSGSGDFEVRPIILQDTIYQEGDYCGNPNNQSTMNFKLGLKSSPGFLNIRWVAEDPAGIERNLGVDCWMNCPASVDAIEGNPSICNGYQSCTFNGPTGEHACSIIDPQYLFDADNRVACRFYDLLDPSLSLEVPERVFRTVDFDIQTSPVTITVGSETNLPVTVKSFSALQTHFTNNMTVLNNEDGLVLTENAVADTEQVTCGQTTQTIPSLNFLVAKSTTLSILVHESADGKACTFNLECSYLDNGPYTGVCQSNVCWKRLDVNVNAGALSLSEYNIVGIIAVVLASFFLFFRFQNGRAKRL